jgi:hypothetical protein
MNVIIAPVNDILKLYDPYKKSFVPVTGRSVQLDQYWNRRIAEGSAKIVNNTEEEIKNDI